MPLSVSSVSKYLDYDTSIFLAFLISSFLPLGATAQDELWPPE
jgi:hypothetical protein